jgi:hypothetical protein
MNYTFARFLKVKVYEPIAVAVEYGRGRIYVSHVMFAIFSLGDTCVSEFPVVICLCCLVFFLFFLPPA